MADETKPKNNEAPEENEEKDVKPVEETNKPEAQGKQEKDVHAQRMESAGSMFTGLGQLAEGIGTAAEKMKATVTLSDATAPTSLGTEAIKTMGTQDLSTIIAAPLNAAINAQYAAAKKTLQCINEFGVKDGALAVVTFTFFKNGRKAKLSIPLLTLVPINNMRINEMTYNFKLAIKSSSQLNMVNSSMGSVNAYVGGNVNDALAAINGGKNDQAQYDKEVAELQKAADKQEEEKPAEQKPAEQKPAEQKLAEQKPAGQNAEAAGKKGEKKEGTEGGKKNDAAATDAVKNAVKMEPTFGVSFSSKKDSKATQSSKYSVETSMDVTIKVGPEDMPAGISKMLEILNDSIDVFNPNGELTVSSEHLKLSDGVAVVTAVYHDTEGSIAPEKISCVLATDSSVKPETLNNGDSCQFIFTKPGLYLISAEKLKRAVEVEKEE